MCLSFTALFFHLVHQKCILNRFILLICQLLNFTLVPNSNKCLLTLELSGGADVA